MSQPLKEVNTLSHKWANEDMTDKMTPQNPKPPEDTALRNLDFDCQCLVDESNDFNRAHHIFSPQNAINCAKMLRVSACHETS